MLLRKIICLFTIILVCSALMVFLSGCSKIEENPTIRTFV